MSAESRERFADLMAHTPWRLDLAALLIAAEAQPLPEGALDDFCAAGLAQLDHLAGQVPADGRPDERLRAVLRSFRGEPSDYERLSSSLLPSVLRRRRGLPILLSITWVEVARRAGISAYGVALPGHFIVGVGDPTTFRSDAIDGSRVLVDPWRGGDLLPYDRARDIVEALGHPFRREHLAPADPVATVARILANISAWAAPPLRAGTRLWAVDLALRLPEPPVALMRQRAQALADLGHFTLAARWWEEYAELGLPDAEDARARARRSRARLN